MPPLVFFGLLVALVLGFIFGWGWAFVAALVVLVLWKILPTPDHTAPRDTRPAPPAAGGRGKPARNRDDGPTESGGGDSGGGDSDD